MSDFFFLLVRIIRCQHLRMPFRFQTLDAISDHLKPCEANLSSKNFNRNDFSITVLRFSLSSQILT